MLSPAGSTGDVPMPLAELWTRRRIAAAASCWCSVHCLGLAQIADAAAEVAKGGKSLFFCQSRSVTEAVAEHMRRAGTTVLVHHIAASKEERQLLKRNDSTTVPTPAIACTSTLELGIDVGDLDRVLQAEVPDTVSSFLQRMGRTGRRAGQMANTTFFCELSEGVLQAIALIELAKSGWWKAWRSATAVGPC